MGDPFLIKELLLHAKGMRCDRGSRLAQRFVAREDSEVTDQRRRRHERDTLERLQRLDAARLPKDIRPILTNARWTPARVPR